MNRKTDAYQRLNRERDVRVSTINVAIANHCKPSGVAASAQPSYSNFPEALRAAIWARSGEKAASMTITVGEPKTTTVSGVEIRHRSVTVKTVQRIYVLVDFFSHGDFLRGLLTAFIPWHAILFILDIRDNYDSPQLREKLFVLRQLHLSQMLVLLDKCDKVEASSAFLSGKQEAKVKDAFDEYTQRDEFAGSLRFIRVSLSGAVEAFGDWPERVRDVISLMECTYLNTPALEEGSFVFGIEKAEPSYHTGGSIVSGCLLKGRLNLGSRGELVGLRNEILTTNIYTIEVEGVSRYSVTAGERCSFILRFVPPEDVIPGQAFATPGLLAPTSRFEACVYWFPASEGGRGIPAIKSIDLKYAFYGVDFGGVMKLLHVDDNVMQVNPGDHAKMSVVLRSPVAMEPGTRFVLKDRLGAIGLGVVRKTGFYS